MKCKECGEDINSLISNATATTGCTMDSSGNVELDNEDLNSIAETDEFRCPECDKVIAWNKEEASDFLKGRITIN